MTGDEDERDDGWERCKTEVMRALAREDWVLREITSAAAGEHELMHTAMESKVCWVLAVAYLLGWRGPRVGYYRPMPASWAIGAPKRRAR